MSGTPPPVQCRTNVLLKQPGYQRDQRRETRIRGSREDSCLTQTGDSDPLCLDRLQMFPQPVEALIITVEYSIYL